MIAVSFFCCLLFVGAFGSPTKHPRIVGGTKATLGQFKWMVSLQRRGSVGGHFCGGSIVNQRYVLTAAHCVVYMPAGNMQIQYGVIDNKSPDNIVMVESNTIHESYVHGNNYPNDIAVIKLASDMNLDDVNSGAVTLPDAPLEFENQTTVDVSGWGYTSTWEAVVQQYLLWTSMPMWSSETCSRYVGPRYDPNVHVCAGTLDGEHKQCSGDSGGPLTQNGVQYGIVSWSFKPCNTVNKPAMFTNVGNYRDWIRSKTGA